MLFAIRDIYNRAGFKLSCKQAFKSPPLKLTSSDDVEIVSEVQHKDVLLYLIAIKSFYHFFGSGSVSILDDGSLVSSDFDLLRGQIPGLSIYNVGEIDTTPLPRGGTWERLVLISKLCKYKFIIQLDSDTVTLRPVNEVVECKRLNICFTMLGINSQNKVMTFREISHLAINRTSDHVQAIVERKMGSLQERDSLKYIRGCSGFAGFGKQSFTQQDLVRYSVLMESLCGKKKWLDWGSEQITSNIVVANAPGGRILPPIYYLGYYPGAETSFEKTAKLIHFPGTHRFKKNCYKRLARQSLRVIGASI